MVARLVFFKKHVQCILVLCRTFISKPIIRSKIDTSIEGGFNDNWGIPTFNQPKISISHGVFIFYCIFEIDSFSTGSENRPHHHKMERLKIYYILTCNISMAVIECIHYSSLQWDDHQSNFRCSSRSERTDPRFITWSPSMRPLWDDHCFKQSFIKRRDRKVPANYDVLSVHGLKFLLGSG